MVTYDGCWCVRQPGDTLVVNLLNRVAFPVTFVPSGMNGSAVNEIAAPGQRVTYRLTVPPEVRILFFCLSCHAIPPATTHTPLIFRASDDNAGTLSSARCISLHVVCLMTPGMSQPLVANWTERQRLKHGVQSLTCHTVVTEG